MLTDEENPGRLERILARLPEAFVLRALLGSLLLATFTVVGLDLREMMDAEELQWQDPRRDTPASPLAAPTPSDHIRPYTPRARPPVRNGGKPRLPGLPPDYDEAKALQKRLSFHLGANGKATAIGRIEPGAASDFDRFMAVAKGKVVSLALHSPGGSVSDALALGRRIRKHELSTRVPDNGYCASSCPLLFAAGIEREAGASTWIGVHQIYTSASAIGTIHDGLAEAQRISATCQQYLIDMGVDGRVWTHAMRTPKRSLYIFTPEQLQGYALATKVAGYKIPILPVRKPGA